MLRRLNNFDVLHFHYELSLKEQDINYHCDCVEYEEKTQNHDCTNGENESRYILHGHSRWQRNHMNNGNLYLSLIWATQNWWAAWGKAAQTAFSIPWSESDTTKSIWVTFSLLLLERTLFTPIFISCLLFRYKQKRELNWLLN